MLSRPYFHFPWIPFFTFLVCGKHQRNLLSLENRSGHGINDMESSGGRYWNPIKPDEDILVRDGVELSKMMEIPPFMKP